MGKVLELEGSIYKLLAILDKKGRDPAHSVRRLILIRWPPFNWSSVMSRENIYRVYTEEKNKRNIVRLAAQQFESFTLQPTLGYYHGRSEKSIVVEVIGASERSVTRFASRIQKMNGQKTVLLMKINGRTKVTRG